MNSTDVITVAVFVGFVVGFVLGVLAAYPARRW